MLNENDGVRLTENVTGPNTFGKGIITKPAGAAGCAIAVYKDACEVQFEDDTFLVVPFDSLAKSWDVATGRDVV